MFFYAILFECIILFEASQTDLEWDRASKNRLFSLFSSLSNDSSHFNKVLLDVGFLLNLLILSLISWICSECTSISLVFIVEVLHKKRSTTSVISWSYGDFTSHFIETSALPTEITYFRNVPLSPLWWSSFDISAGYWSTYFQSWSPLFTPWPALQWFWSSAVMIWCNLSSCDVFRRPSAAESRGWGEVIVWFLDPLRLYC